MNLQENIRMRHTEKIFQEVKYQHQREVPDFKTNNCQMQTMYRKSVHWNRNMAQWS